MPKVVLSKLNKMRKYMSKDFNAKMHDLKQAMSKLPRSDSKEFEHFTEFFGAFHKFTKSIKDGHPDEQIKSKYFYHLEMIWSHILREFMQPYWFFGKKDFGQEIENGYLTGPMDTQILKTRIQNAIDQDQLPDFFAAFPYVKDLLIIDRNLFNFSKDEPDVFRDTMRMMAEYIDILEHYDNIFPLLVLREHVHLMLKSNQFDQDFYIKYMKGAEVCLRDRGHDADTDLMFLSLFIGKDIPYALRKVAGFNQFNWDAFDGLYRNLKSVDKAELPNILLGLERYINELILFQLGELPEENLHKVNIAAIELANMEANVNPAFAIIDDYLRIATLIVEDSSISRLATLRAITAIGEAINSINLLIPEEHRAALEIIINLRDHIVHSSTYEASRFIDDLINNMANRTLVDVLPEIRGLQPFINELKNWFASPKAVDTFPHMSVIQATRDFEVSYTAARKKDDRSEKLSLADYDALQNLIPADEEADNPHYARIEDFVQRGILLDRNHFVEACIGCHNNNNLRTVHDIIKEINKVISIRQFSSQESFDFNKINLNIPKTDKAKLAKLKKIKEERNLVELEEFLDAHLHKQLEHFNVGDFLNSVRRINLTPYKDILKNFVAGEIVSKEDFHKAVAVVFKNNVDTAQIWHDAYTKFMGHINSIKRDQITQLEYSIANIESLKDTAAKIFDGRGIDTQVNPVISIACEMLYGFCSDSFKSINKFINLLHDYSDETLYFFAYKHPLKEVQGTLDIAVQIRHQMFHFEQVFNGEDIFLSRMIWFSMIQNMTHGMFFPEAIVISPDGVSKQEMFSESSLEKLTKFMVTLKNDLGRNPDTLNMYMATLDKMLPTGIPVVSSVESGILHRAEEKENNEYDVAPPPLSSVSTLVDRIEDDDVDVELIAGLPQNG